MSTVLTIVPVAGQLGLDTAGLDEVLLFDDDDFDITSTGWYLKYKFLCLQIVNRQCEKYLRTSQLLHLLIGGNSTAYDVHIISI